MAKKLVTTKDKCHKKARMATKKFMLSVREFIASKNEGEVPQEMECSLMLLENFYFEFIQITTEISMLDSLLINGRYGPAPSPLLNAQTTISHRIESMLKELGLTMKAKKQLKFDTKPEDTSPLAQWVSNNKEVERR